MISIRIIKFKHRGMWCLGTKFPFNTALKDYIKKYPGCRYSKTHQCFYVVYAEGSTNELTEYLKTEGYGVLLEFEETSVQTNKSLRQRLPPLTEEKREIMDDFTAFLKGKRFSVRTIKVYYNFVKDFLRFSGDTTLCDLTEENVRLYVEWTVTKLKYSASTHRQVVSAIHHFSHFYPECEIEVEKIFRPKADRKLPVVLNIEEVLLLIQVTKNLKHRVIIAMLYGSGLRIGELLNLQLSDFDFKRKQLRITNAKGRKDRYVTIAERIFPMLKNYYMTYTPKYYFIEGASGGMYTSASIRAFLKKSCKLAGISKKVSPHTLRHSYATHLMEQGTGLRHIQELLGHSRPETTMIYTHVTCKELEQVRSPLDAIIKGNTKLYIDNKNDRIF